MFRNQMNLKFKKHIADLFKTENDSFDQLGLIRFTYLCEGIFNYDPEAEIRIRIGGQVYFIQITDMEVMK